MPVILPTLQKVLLQASFCVCVAKMKFSTARLFRSSFWQKMNGAVLTPCRSCYLHLLCPMTLLSTGYLSRHRTFCAAQEKQMALTDMKASPEPGHGNCPPRYGRPFVGSD